MRRNLKDILFRHQVFNYVFKIYLIKEKDEKKEWGKWSLPEDVKVDKFESKNLIYNRNVFSQKSSMIIKNENTIGRFFNIMDALKKIKPEHGKIVIEMLKIFNKPSKPNEKKYDSRMDKYKKLVKLQPKNMKNKLMMKFKDEYGLKI